MTAALAERAREIVGAAHLVTEPEHLTAYMVDGIRPGTVARPETPEETAALLVAAGDAGAGVLPRGAGTHQHLGGLPSRADLVVDTTLLVGITDYTPADYVVAIRAGTPLRDLTSELGRHNQWLPIDPPGAGRATIGGIIAANRNGPRRLLWGSIRDILIGIRVALPTGEVIKAGGKVVKNVAGYDLTKLFIGSFGAFGVITEATFKISPRPSESLTVFVTVPDLDGAHAVTTAVMRSYLLPSALEAVNPPALRRLALAAGLREPPAGTWGVVLLAEGMTESLARHTTEMRTLVDGRGQMEVLQGPGHDALWNAVAEFQSPSSHPGGVVCRAGGPLARWADVVQGLDASGAIAGPVEILVHAGLGLLYCACAPESGTRLADALGRAAAEIGGYAVVEVAPPGQKAGLPLWGTPPGGLDLMRRLREKFDPRGIMIPGRLGWGLS